MLRANEQDDWHWQGPLKLLLWSVFSSGTIFLNKRLYTSGGFPYPLASTAMGQLTTALGGCMLVTLGIFPKKPLPNISQAYYQLVPAVLATSGTLFAGNYAYLTLSIAFMQVLLLLCSPCDTQAVRQHNTKRSASMQGCGLYVERYLGMREHRNVPDVCRMFVLHCSQCTLHLDSERVSMTEGS